MECEGVDRRGRWVCAAATRRIGYRRVAYVCLCVQLWQPGQRVGLGLAGDLLVRRRRDVVDEVAGNASQGMLVFELAIMDCTDRAFVTGSLFNRLWPVTASGGRVRCAQVVVCVPRPGLHGICIGRYVIKWQGWRLDGRVGFGERQNSRRPLARIDDPRPKAQGPALGTHLGQKPSLLLCTY